MICKGVRIDYKGEDVTPENFMAVLLGDEEKVEGKRVLKRLALASDPLQ